jgi:sugar lactone lactonase YvrE
MWNRVQDLDAASGVKVPEWQEILPANYIFLAYPGGHLMLITRKLWFLPLVVLFLTSSSIFSVVALAPIFDRYADAVLGQPDFISWSPNNGGISAQSLNRPGGIAIDPASGRLYVADTYNNRVLSWPGAASFANHAAADIVFGQGGVFNTNTANKGGVSANSLYRPSGLAVDGQGNLYVADTDNHRILRFNNPPVSNTEADMVFGQGGVFTSNSANNGGTASDDSLNRPAGIALDSGGNLYVADTANNRLLKFNNPNTTDTTADLVIGQPNFTATAFVDPPTAASLTQPEGVAVDSAGNLYVADTGNFRVVGYEIPLATHKSASRLFGQENLTSNVEYCVTAPSASNMCYPTGLFIDSSGVLFVSDVQFDRLLLFYTPLSGAPPLNADEVIGQPDFTSELTPKPPYSYGLDYPNAVFVDSQRNLYVSDSNNNRVLRFDTVGATNFIYLPVNRK